MTIEILSKLFSFDSNIQHVEIISDTEVEERAHHIVAKLTLADGTSMVLPFIWYDGEEWLLTPWDWQSEPSTSINDIDSITWRVNDSEKEATIVNGLPRLLV
ncbi:hypothetical protein [uncultured Bacteroides sp.]|uniref:hypothetical protein n=1 Tax=uncultured Bacteroides sp. TaxID=162156 RepID=UPI00261C4C75|nr:hypothetical protein [uncultured Bacteroides sp.]